MSDRVTPDMIERGTEAVTLWLMASYDALEYLGSMERPTIDMVFGKPLAEVVLRAALNPDSGALAVGVLDEPSDDETEAATNAIVHYFNDRPLQSATAQAQRVARAALLAARAVQHQERGVVS